MVELGKQCKGTHVKVSSKRYKVFIRDNFSHSLGPKTSYSLDDYYLTKVSFSSFMKDSNLKRNISLFSGGWSSVKKHLHLILTGEWPSQVPRPTPLSSQTGKQSMGKLASSDVVPEQG